MITRRSPSLVELDTQLGQEKSSFMISSLSVNPITSHRKSSYFEQILVLSGSAGSMLTARLGSSIPSKLIVLLWSLVKFE